MHFIRINTANYIKIILFKTRPDRLKKIVEWFKLAIWFTSSTNALQVSCMQGQVVYKQAKWFTSRTVGGTELTSRLKNLQTNWMNCYTSRLNGLQSKVVKLVTRKVKSSTIYFTAHTRKPSFMQTCMTVFQLHGIR